MNADNDQAFELQNMAREDLIAALKQSREAEVQLRDLHQRKDEFLAMLGHELRNPLGPIRNAAELIALEHPSDSPLQNASEVIERQTQHLARVIDDLLDVLRISQGRIKLVKEPTNVTEILRTCVTDFAPYAHQEGLTLEADLNSKDLWVNGDPIRLTQIFANLLENAGKYSARGDTITIQQQYLPNLNEVVIKIRDTGVGIASEMLPRLFVAFAPVRDEADRRSSGLGLGLALVHGLIELHGGTIQASSPGMDQGAIFTIRLPLVPAPEPLASRSSGPFQAPRYRILVIDDHRDSILMLRRLLERMGQEVHTAMDGEAGLRIAREIEPQILLSDIGLPGISGYEVAKSLRSLPQKRPALMVAVTGHGRDEDMRAALAAGFDRHLVKPIGFSDLQRLLEAVPVEQRSSSAAVPVTDNAAVRTTTEPAHLPPR